MKIRIGKLIPMAEYVKKVPKQKMPFDPHTGGLTTKNLVKPKPKVTMTEQIAVVKKVINRIGKQYDTLLEALEEIQGKEKSNKVLIKMEETNEMLRQMEAVHRTLVKIRNITEITS